MRQKSTYIKIARKSGSWTGDWELAEFRELNQPKTSLHTKRERKIVELADAVEEVESCGACHGYLLPALQKLKEEGLLEKLRTKSVLDRDIGKTGSYRIGQCTRKFEHHLLGGCLTEEEI